MEELSRTTINIRRGTKRRLHDLGRMEETYDDLINRLLDELLECKKRKSKGEN